MKILFLRGTAFYIDGFFVALLTIISFLIHRSLLNDLAEQLENYYAFTLLGYHIFSYFAYFIFCEYFFLKTIGKKLLNFQIKAENDDSLKFLIRIIVRAVVRYFPFNFISFCLVKKNFFGTRYGPILILTGLINNL